MTALQNSVRSRAPVFVLGSPRSGTTLLYDMLLSAGGFAVYLAEANVFNLLAPRFGDLHNLENRRKLIDAWVHSKLFRASGLDRETITRKLLHEGRSPGDFLQILMTEVARTQGMQRWAENSPEGLLHLPTIKNSIPDALVVHIIRDGRDVAMSLGNVRYLRPFPWEERQSPIAAGVYWEWIVQQGREMGKGLRSDYLEVHFEDLISSPQATLGKIGEFIQHDLNYDRILRVGYGSVTRPNTSFRSSSGETTFNPVKRWKQGLPVKQLNRLEVMIGPTLVDLGYELSHGGPPQDVLTLGQSSARLAYRSYFEAKQWFKRNPVIRAVRPQLTSDEIDATVLAEDHPPQIRQPGALPLATTGDRGRAKEKICADVERLS